MDKYLKLLLILGLATSVAEGYSTTKTTKNKKVAVRRPSQTEIDARQDKFSVRAIAARGQRNQQLQRLRNQIALNNAMARSVRQARMNRPV